MPTITVDPKRLFELVGRRFDAEDLMNLGLDVEVTEEGLRKIEYNRNRPDMSGITGIARAVKGFLEVELGLPKYEVVDTVICTLNGRVRGREYIAAAVVEFNDPINEAIIEELIEAQELLCSTYGRRRELVAIGLHDFDKIKCPIKYVEASPDTTMVPLNHTEEKTLKRILENTEQGLMYGNIVKEAKSYPILVDDEGKVIAFPPVINSEITRLKPGVKRLFIDVTGTRDDLVRLSLEIMVANALEYGGKAYRIKANGELFPKLDVREVIVDPNEASRISGIPISLDEFVMGLKRSRLGRNGSAALVPSYRADVMGPIDVIENALIGYGINNIAAHAERPPSVDVGRKHSFTSFSEYIREILVGLGFVEIISPTLVKSERYIDYMNMPAGGYVKLANPISKEHDMVRAQLIPVLLKVLRENRKTEYPQKIFELGEVVKVGTKPTFRRFLGFAVAHSKASFSEIKGYTEALMRLLNLEPEYESLEKPYYLPGRAARIVVDGETVGELGEIHPNVLRKFEIFMPVAVAEVNVSKLYSLVIGDGGGAQEDQDRV